MLSELAKQDVMSRLTKLEQKMNDLDRNADALIDELESLEAVARELKWQIPSISSISTSKR